MAIKFAGLEPCLRARAEATLKAGIGAGLHPVITSVRRTWAEQEEIYTHWRDCLASGAAYSNAGGGACQYPALPPGLSAHNYGLAWDSTVNDDEWSQWNTIRMAFGWIVPGDDQIHAEPPNWPALVTSWMGQVG